VLPPLTLDPMLPLPHRQALLGELVEHIGNAHFLPALLGWCRAAAGASDCSLIVHRHAGAELAGAASLAGTRAQDVGDWYMRGAWYRMEPSLRVAAGALPGQLCLHALGRPELPDTRWRERYAQVGLEERLSLGVPWHDGWVFINAYRPPGCPLPLAAARQALADQAPVLAAAVRRHLAAGTPAAASPLDALSARERQVVDAILAGASAKEAARTLGLSPTSVATYRQRAFDKLGIRRQVQLFQLVRG